LDLDLDHEGPHLAIVTDMDLYMAMDLDPVVGQEEIPGKVVAVIGQ